MRRALIAVALTALVRCSDGGATPGTSNDAGVDVSMADAASAGDGGGDAADGADATADAIAFDGGLGESVLEHHLHATRDGAYVQPRLTKAAAANMHRDTSFDGTVGGNVYAQPLYVESGVNGKGTFYVVTESDQVFALDETTGSTVWQKTLGTPAQNPSANCGPCCGNIHPIGITGTPVIDLPSRTIFIDAVVDDGQGAIKTHEIHALSIDSGAERQGWPLDVATVRSTGNTVFNPVVQNQRGASTILRGTLYVPYGAHGGDCSQYGIYHGWVVAVPIANPSSATAYATASNAAGIWAPGGVTSDGISIFATTGNAFGASTWGGSEAVLRLGGGASFSGRAADYFAPSNWQTLDNQDLDLGGSPPVVVDVRGATPSALIVALGKDRNAYLLDRANLGGIGGAVTVASVAGAPIVNAPTSYTTARGTYVAFLRGGGANVPSTNCPMGQATGDVIALEIGATAPPSITTAWCQSSGGNLCSPISTTTDGTSDAIVWTLGCENSRRLRGFDGETGAIVFGGGGNNDVFAGVHHFSTLVAVHGRLFIAGDNKLFAYTP